MNEHITALLRTISIGTDVTNTKNAITKFNFLLFEKTLG